MKPKKPLPPLPPPKELAERQEALLKAALKGEKAFDGEWDRIFHPKAPEPPKK